MVVMHVRCGGRRGERRRVVRVVGWGCVWGLVVWVGVQSAGWRIASVVAQAQGARGVGNAVGGVVEASTGERESKPGYEGNLRHRLPQLRRASPFLLHVWFTNIVQWVTGVRRVGVEAAEVNPEDCGQEVPVDIMMRRRAACASYATTGPAPHSWHSARPRSHAYPAAEPVPRGAVCYPYFTQSHHDLVQLSEKVWIVPPRAQLQVLLLAFPLLSL